MSKIDELKQNIDDSAERHAALLCESTVEVVEEMADKYVAAAVERNQLRSEVDRLRRKLINHGIDPDGR